MDTIRLGEAEEERALFDALRSMCTAGSGTGRLLCETTLTAVDEGKFGARDTYDTIRCDTITLERIFFFFHSSKTVEDVVARYSGYGMAWYRYDDGDYLRRAFP